ncbi:hypothetical protein [Aquimarina sp. I32.4]|uniref:hypothetical protein n=1 Tax=Aquimarina sp. I32.4 TaxID=2053903 RepID=UPI001304B045|nr:hypothetical protein [Aquimarina sp. I32.4]
MEKHEYDMPPKVFYGILNALDIDIGKFATNLFNDEPKAVMIYVKMYILYRKSQNKE